MSIWKKAVGLGATASLLASLLVTIVAPTALATVTTTGVGTVGQGTTSTTAATWVFTEDAKDAFTFAGSSVSMTVTILDHAGNPTVHFVGTGTVTAPGSLGASLTQGDNFFTVKLTGHDDLNVEQFTVSGLKIKADLGAATGAIQANVVADAAITTGFLASATGTATGTVQSGIGAGALGVNVILASGSCNFVATGTVTGTVTSGKLAFATSPESVTISAAAAPVTGVQALTIAATTNPHNPGEAVSQTGVPCAADLSPGTVGIVLIQDVPGTAPTVNPGEQNQSATPTTLAERSVGQITNPTTITFTLSPAGVQFSSSPYVEVTAGNITLSSKVCNLSFDRTSCSVTTSGVSTVLSTLQLQGNSTLGSPIKLDVASTVAAGQPVNVTITTSPTNTIHVSANTIANVGRVIVGVAAQPTIFINYNDQQTGMLTLKEAASGFFQGGTGSNNTFGLCIRTGETFTRAPWAVVTVGDLMLLNGTTHLGATSLMGTLFTAGGRSCAYWTVYSASTVASTVEIRGSDATGAVLPTGALNGPRLSVPNGLAPGTTQEDILVGSNADVLADNAAAFSSIASNATRAFKSGVVVAVVPPVPTIAKGSGDSLGANLTITETLNGQFKPDQEICVEILPRSTNFAIQDTLLKTANTNDLPVITTNAASGLLTDSVGTPGCANFEGDGFMVAPNLTNSFSFTVSQQSFGSLGQITISNIHLITVADAPLGSVLMSVSGDNDGGAVPFQTVVTDANIGTAAGTTWTTGTALGNTLVGPFTSSTKIQHHGGYITWKFDGGAAAANQTVQIWAYKKTSLHGTWSAAYMLTTRKTNASGVAYANIRSGSSSLWLSIRPVLGTNWGPTSIGRWIR